MKMPQEKHNLEVETMIVWISLQVSCVMPRHLDKIFSFESNLHHPVRAPHVSPRQKPQVSRLWIKSGAETMSLRRDPCVKTKP